MGRIFRIALEKLDCVSESVNSCVCVGSERPLEQRITSRINIDVKLRMLNWNFTGDFSWISFTVMAERKKEMYLEGNPVPGACLVSLLQDCVPSKFTFCEILVT